MKIIMSLAGGGKTKKTIELAIQHMLEGKTVHILSGEYTSKDILEVAYHQGLDLEKVKNIKYTFVNTIKEALGKIESENIDVTFLDEVVNHSNLEDNPVSYENKEELLDLINELEGDNLIYVTQQMNLNDIRSDDEKLIIFDYIPSQREESNES